MSSNHTILVIEVDRDIAEGVSIRLRASGYRVLTAAEGIRGFAMALEQRPDAILLDLRRPATDGLATLTRLRREKSTSDIPVVAFSVSQAQRQAAVESEIQYYVDKPCNAKALLESIRSAIADATARTNRRPPSRMGGFTELLRIDGEKTRLALRQIVGEGGERPRFVRDERRQALAT